MNLARALGTFAKPLLRTSTWYDWKIPDKKLPVGIVVNPGTNYQRNVDLKLALHADWIKADRTRQSELACFYVRDWGGIKRNSAGTLDRYVASTTDELVRNGYDGVATWSKILCMHDPHRYAIFDARVSVALNALQVVYRIKSPIFFQPLASQNKAIAGANDRLRARALQQGWHEASSQTYYSTYLKTLGAVGTACGVPLYTMEMLLFARAEELSAKI